MSKDSRAQINNTLDSVAAIGLKVGAVMVGLALAYLLYVVFGPKLAAMKTMGAADKSSLMQNIGWARTMLKCGSFVLVLGLCIRFFYEETTGVILTLAGGVVYFFSPSAFSSLTLGSLKQSLFYQAIVNDIATVGLVCVVPGILLLVRDVVMRVLTRFGAWHEVPTSAVEDNGLRRDYRKHKPYEMCWDMACCNERVRRFCPAWKKHKPCWQLKAGCMCDEEVVKLALLDRDGEQQSLQHAAVDARPKLVLSAEQKSARCRSCTIYLEHQRQKFRIASPVVIVLVAVAYALVYSRAAALLYNLLKGMDRFMSFVSYRHGADISFASQGHVVTTLAMICIGVALLSFTLRALDYLIFDLQI